MLSDAEPCQATQVHGCLPRVLRALPIVTRLNHAKPTALTTPSHDHYMTLHCTCSGTTLELLPAGRPPRKAFACHGAVIISCMRSALCRSKNLRATDAKKLQGYHSVLKLSSVYLEAVSSCLARATNL